MMAQKIVICLLLFVISFVSCEISIASSTPDLSFGGVVNILFTGQFENSSTYKCGVTGDLMVKGMLVNLSLLACDPFTPPTGGGLYTPYVQYNNSVYSSPDTLAVLSPPSIINWSPNISYFTLGFNVITITGTNFRNYSQLFTSISVLHYMNAAQAIEMDASSYMMNSSSIVSLLPAWVPGPSELQAINQLPNGEGMTTGGYEVTFRGDMISKGPAVNSSFCFLGMIPIVLTMQVPSQTDDICCAFALDNSSIVVNGGALTATENELVYECGSPVVFNITDMQFYISFCDENNLNVLEDTIAVSSTTSCFQSLSPSTQCILGLQSTSFVGYSPISWDLQVENVFTTQQGQTNVPLESAINYDQKSQQIWFYSPINVFYNQSQSLTQTVQVKDISTDSLTLRYTDSCIGYASPSKVYVHGAIVSLFNAGSITFGDGWANPKYLQNLECIFTDGANAKFSSQATFVSTNEIQCKSPSNATQGQGNVYLQYQNVQTAPVTIYFVN